MRAAILGVVILALLIGSQIAIGRAGGDAPDPGEPGPYAVGLASRTFSRVLPNGQTRNVQTSVWYPAPRSADMPPVLATAADPNAAIAPGGPFPLIVFSHGSGATSSLYSKLLSHLATHGFVVAGPNHQDCTTCTDLSRGGASENRPADVVMIVDQLVALNRTDDPIFRGLVDQDRIGMAGQSFGGWTTLTVLERDPRFKAGLALSPGTLLSPYVRPERVARPLMLMAGMLDAMVPYALTARFFADIPSSAPDHYLLVAPHVGHQFHNNCIPGFVTTGCNDTLPQPRVQAMMDRVGTAFLLRYVAGRRITDTQLGLHGDDSEYTVLKATPAGSPPVPTPAPLHAADPATSPPPGTVLWQTGQGERLSGSADPATYEVAEVGGGYEIRAKQPGMLGYAVVPGDYRDTTVAVDVSVSDPVPSQGVQLGCRSQGPTAQYRLGFRPATGEIWINRWLTLPNLGAPFRSLTPPEQYTAAVRQGSATNHVELTCRGTTLSARINGQAVLSVPDNTFGTGHILIGTSYAPDGVMPSPPPAVRFSNLTVTQE